MSTETVFGLSGKEIISDLLYQIEKHLDRDCNLRGMDCYEGGYSAKVHVEMKLHGIDTASIDTTLALGTADERPGMTVDETIEIAADQRLDQVRKRSEQTIPSPTLEKIPEGMMDTQQQPQRRGRYQRATPHPVNTETNIVRQEGSATGESLETE